MPVRKSEGPDVERLSQKVLDKMEGKNIVTSAKAGVHSKGESSQWIPASAGMTMLKSIVRRRSQDDLLKQLQDICHPRSNGGYR